MRHSTLFSLCMLIVSQAFTLNGGLGDCCITYTTFIRLMEQYKASHVDMLVERQRLTDRFGMIHAAKIAIKSEYMLSSSSSSSFFSQPIAHLGHHSSPNARAGCTCARPPV